MRKKFKLVILFIMIFMFVFALSACWPNEAKLEIIGTITMDVDYNQYLGHSVSVKGTSKV